MSLDAVRGFDMFWIAGGEELIRGLYKAEPMGLTKVLDGQMHHKAWIGMNPITVYLAFNLFSIGDLTEASAGGPIKTALGSCGYLVEALVAVTIMFALVRYLYRHKIFLRL